MGIVFTRNVPGIAAIFAVSAAPAEAARNRSSLLTMFIPYVISMTSAATTLTGGILNELWVEQRLY